MADIFPDLQGLDLNNLIPLDSDDPTVVATQDENAPIPFGVSWQFDFLNGDIFLDNQGQPHLVEGTDELKEWISHFFSIDAGETTIFDDTIGTDILTFIGATTTLDGHTISRIEAEIISGLKQHDRIQTVQRILTLPVGGDLYVYIKYTTDADEEHEELVVI